MHHVPGLFLLVAELTQAFRGHGVRGGARISGAIPGSDLFRDSPNCALPGGTSRIGRPPQYRHPGHNPHDGRTAQLRDGHLHEHGPGNRPH
jgi:hypothetical protein